MFIAFENTRRLASGSLAEIALAIRKRVDQRGHGQIIVFDHDTSETVEVDARGTLEDLARRFSAVEATDNACASGISEKRGPGRPKLGVIGREVTLLPRHWDWLDRQPGGASVALRKLVEAARRSNQSRDRLRHAQDAVYRFMSAITGDLSGFEEALRSFYANDFTRFGTLIAAWPPDVRDHLKSLADKVEKARQADSASASTPPV